MRQSRFTEAQIIRMIKEQEAGMPTAEVCRRHGLSPASFYKFKAKYGGMHCTAGYRAAMSREWTFLTPTALNRLKMRTAN
jgi:putative transposase